MTEQQDTTPPEAAAPIEEPAASAGEGLADEPIPDAGAAAEPGADGPEAGTARSRDWLNQLETMISEIATQAAPVARQVGAKAAELAAVAATKAGPLAQKAAEVTTDVGQRFAERAQAVAAELRAEGGVPAGAEGAEPEAATEPAEPAADAPAADAPAGDEPPVA